MDGAEEYGNRLYTVTVTTGSINQDISFNIPSDQQPPQKIRFFNGSISIAVFNFVKKLDKYVELTKDEFERFDRGFKIGQCRHQSHVEAVNRENGDERFHKRLAKLQKKLKEKNKNENYCSYCEEYGDVISIEMPKEPIASEAMTDNSTQINLDELKLSKLEAVALGPTSIKISWKESVMNNEQLRNCTFELQMSKSKSSSFHTIYRGSDPTFTQVDLRPGTKYYFSVRVLKDSVQGAFSQEVCVLTDATAPSTPDPPYISNKTKSNLVLKWTTKGDNGSPITSYILQCDKGYDGSSFHTIYEGSQKQYKFSHKLAPMETCRFRVKAVNKIGESDFSPELSYTASAGVPSAPDPPSLVYSRANSLELSWKTPNDNGAEITEYALQMEDQNKGYGFLPVYRGSELKCVVDELKRNTKYNFRLSAVNSQGDSKWSDVIAFSTTSQIPARLSAPILEGKIHTQSFSVVWAPPSDDGGSEIVGYTLQINDEKGGSFREAYSGLDMHYRFQNLLPGHTYKIRVSCASSSFQSPWSDIINIKTLPVVSDPPSAPRQSKESKPQPCTIELRWDPPANNGGANIINYNVQMCKSDDKEDFHHIYLGPRNSCTASELVPNRKYNFRVRAHNAAGDSKFSDTSVISTAPGPPDVVSKLEVLVKSSYVLKVSWKIPRDNGSPVTGYLLQWAEKSTGPFEKLYSGVERFYEIKKNISPSTVYYFRVQVSSEAGYSNWSNVVSCKTAAAPPRQITYLKVVGQTSSSLILQWQVPHDSGAPITSYNIDIIGCKMTTFALDGNKSADVADISDIEPRMLTYVLPGLEPHTQYRFRIQAVNKSGCGAFSSVISARTSSVPPEAPVIETVNSSYQSVKLHWKYNHMQSETSELNYELQMRSEDVTNFVTVFNGSSTTHKVNKLQEETTYSFRVRAGNEAGYGAYSDVFICQTGVQPPPAVKITGHHGTNNKVTLTWNKVTPQRPSDHITYVLERQRKGLTELEQIYEGEKTTYTCNNLTPEKSYSFRACVIRILADGRRIQSAYSPLAVFTVPSQIDEDAFKLTSNVDSHEEEPPVAQLTERTLAVSVFIAFAVIVLIMALLTPFLAT